MLKKFIWSVLLEAPLNASFRVLNMMIGKRMDHPKETRLSGILVLDNVAHMRMVRADNGLALYALSLNHDWKRARRRPNGGGERPVRANSL